MLPESRYSADPELDAGIASRLDDIVAIAREEAGDSLQSVVLGGSLARGEAFGVRDVDGVRLLSDLDLFFVADGETGDLVPRIAGYARRDPFLVVRPDLGVVRPGWFSQSPEAMPTHQLAHAHRVLWGREISLAAAKDEDGSARVDSADASELLLNRFIEALDPALDEPLPRLMHRTKEFIDAPMAWLGSVGEYTPDRRAQVERLRAIAASEALEPMLDHWSACLDARQRGVVTRDELAALASHERWQEWTGGFALALLTGGSIAPVVESVRRGLDRPRLRDAVQAWLVREPWFGRLRRARQWSGIAPKTVTSWRRHGLGGSGPDRIFGAACLAYHGAPGWLDPVDGLTREGITSPAQLHDLWWSWIQGRADG